jgi:hypothetical protein
MAFSSDFCRPERRWRKCSVREHCWMQPVLLQERDHIPVEQPRLLDLTGRTGAVEIFISQPGMRSLTAGAGGCEPSSLPVRMMVGHLMRVVVRRVRLGQRLKLINDRPLAASLAGGGGGTARQGGERR